MDVSVIIPTYNRLWSLPRAIDSCKFTHCKTEIIVVDDGSTDGTWEWLKNQSDVVIVRQENKGQTYAINNGVSIAKGRFIRFLDSDDFLEAGIIDTQFELATTTGSELICSRVDLYDEQTNTVTVCPDINHWTDFLEVQLGTEYGSHFLGILFHRSLIEQVPRRPDYAYREDRMFLLEVASRQPQMAIASGCAGYWVQHNHQMQANYSGFKSQVVNWQHLAVYRHILNRLENTGNLTDAYKKAACQVLWPLAHWIAKSHLREAQEVVNWIYDLDPNFEVPENYILRFLFHNAGYINTQKILRLRRKLKGK